MTPRDRPDFSIGEDDMEYRLGRSLYEEMLRLDPGDDDAWEALSPSMHDFYRLCAMKVIGDRDTFFQIANANDVGGGS